MSCTILPCPTVNPEINPLLSQTLGKWYVSNVNELAAFTEWLFTPWVYWSGRQKGYAFLKITACAQRPRFSRHECISDKNTSLVWGNLVIPPLHKSFASFIFVKIVNSYFSFGDLMKQRPWWKENGYRSRKSTSCNKISQSCFRCLCLFTNPSSASV